MSYFKAPNFENDGTDEIDVSGMSGELADIQKIYIDVLDSDDESKFSGEVNSLLLKEGDNVVFSPSGSGESVLITVESSGSGASAHNDLTGIQGGEAEDYQHLTSGQVAALHTRQHSITDTNDHSFPDGSNVFLNGDGEFSVPFPGLADITSAVTISNSSTETQIVAATIPADSMVAGSHFRIHFAGNLSSNAMGAGTGTWRLRLGPNTLTGTILSQAAIAAITNGLLGAPLVGFIDLTIRSDGALGSGFGLGQIAGKLGTAGAFLWVESNLVSAGGVDTTVDNILELTFKFGTADVSNTLVTNVAVIEKIM